jgi:hypothetical protein
MSVFPEIHSWFTDRLDYEGYGYAEFSDPQGTAEGPIKIQFDESGITSVEMNVEKITPPQSFPLFIFLSGERPDKNGFVGWGSNSKGNPCTKLTVNTPEGTFCTVAEVAYNSSNSTLNFHPPLQFESKNSGNAKYWVLPLSNFLSGFAEFEPSLENHPLRIVTFPPLENLTGEEKLIYQMQMRRLILFQFCGALGFIEPLIDYEERRRKLEEGNAQSLITAVMVGEISHHAINISDLNQWFPWSFLRLLSLATGTKVESPWIEFRDEKGDLVRRIHHHFSLPEIAQKRHVILREWEIPRDPDTGIGA